MSSHTSLGCVLAIDTASPSPGVSVWTGDGSLDEALPAERQASERLLHAIEQCLRRAGIDLEGCRRIAVCAGPGSFTGVRVGLATAWGLARSTGAELEPVSTLEVLAESARLSHEGSPIAKADSSVAGAAENSSVVGAALDAGRGEIVWQAFDLSGERARPTTEAARATARAAAEAAAARFHRALTFVCMPASLLGDAALAVAPAEPLARVLARTVARHPSAELHPSLSAFYARPSAAQEKHGRP